MGLHDRDYIRDSSPKMGGAGGSVGSGWPPVCKWILIANIVVFLLQIFTTREVVSSSGFVYRDSVVESWLELDTDKILGGQVWRLVTTAFCHARTFLWHIVFNMLFLVWFGMTLERMYGSAEFLRFYLTSAVVASLAYVGLDLITGDRVPAIGASGAVMGVVMLYAMHFPRQKIYLWMLFPIEIRWIVLFYVLFDLHPVLLALAGEETHTGVAHAAHLGGLAFGFLYYRFGWSLGKVYSLGGRLGVRLGGGKSSPPVRPQKATPRKPKKKKKKKPKSKSKSKPNPKIRIARSDPLEDKVDELLQKISEEGASSLTDEERKFLERASKQYRERDQ